jgi:hypothetical protein
VGKGNQVNPADRRRTLNLQRRISGVRSTLLTVIEGCLEKFGAVEELKGDLKEEVGSEHLIGRAESIV